MQVNRGSWRDFGPDLGSGKARRFKFRRRVQAAARRPQFVRSDVRRGPQAALALPEPALPLAEAEAAYEKLMTLRLQAAIVTAMLGISLFYRAPLLAALKALFAQ